MSFLRQYFWCNVKNFVIDAITFVLFHQDLTNSAFCLKNIASKIKKFSQTSPFASKILLQKWHAVWACYATQHHSQHHSQHHLQDQIQKIYSSIFWIFRMYTPVLPFWINLQSKFTHSVYIKDLYSSFTLLNKLSQLKWRCIFTFAFCILGLEPSQSPQEPNSTRHAKKFTLKI